MTTAKPDVFAVLKRTDERIARQRGYDPLGDDTLKPFADAVRPLIETGVPVGPDPAAAAELEELRAKVQALTGELSEERADHENHASTLLRERNTAQDERDQARAELETAQKQAETWEREYERVRDDAAEMIAERSSSDDQRHRHFYPAEAPGKPLGPCVCGKPYPRAHIADRSHEPGGEPDPWARIFADLRNDLADWPPQRSAR